MGSGDESSRSVDRSEIGRREVDGEDRGGEVAHGDRSARVVDLAPYRVGVQALVFDGTREHQVAPAAIDDVVGAAEDRRQDRGGHGQIDQLGPLRTVEHVSRHRGAAEGVAVGETSGPAADGTFGVGLEQGGRDFVRASSELFELLGLQSVSHGDEPVTMEDRRRSFDIAAVDDLEALDTVAFPESLPQRDHVGIVKGASPGGASGIAFHEVAVLGGRLDVDLTDR